mgnify:CR=1 FL=1
MEMAGEKIIPSVEHDLHVARLVVDDACTHALVGEDVTGADLHDEPDLG